MSDSDDYENLLLHKYRNAQANRKKGKTRKYPNPKTPPTKKSSNRFDDVYLNSKSEIYGSKRPPTAFNPIYLPPGHPTGDPYCYFPIYYVPTNFLQPNLNPYFPPPFLPTPKGRRRVTKSKSMVTLVPSCLSQDQFEQFYTPPDLELSPSYEELLNEAHANDENHFLDLNIADNLSYFYNKDFTSQSTLNTEVKLPKGTFKKANPLGPKSGSEFQSQKTIEEDEDFPRHYKEFLEDYKKYSNKSSRNDRNQELFGDYPSGTTDYEIGGFKKDASCPPRDFYVKETATPGLREECVEFLKKCSELSKDSKQFPIDCRDDHQLKSIMKQPRDPSTNKNLVNPKDYKDFRRDFQKEFKHDFSEFPAKDFKQYMKSLSPKEMKESGCLTEHSPLQCSGSQTHDRKQGSKNVQTHLRDITKMLLLLPYEDKTEKNEKAFKELFCDKSKMKPKSPYHILSPPTTPHEGNYRKFPPAVTRSHTPEPILPKRRSCSPPSGKKTVTLVSNKDMLYSKVNKK